MTSELSREIDREALKRWAVEELERMKLKNTTIAFADVHKRKHGITKTKIVNNNGTPEKYFEIVIYKGRNLEELKDELDVEMFRDIVRHEICHVLV
ncbi:MAG: hypothetical protein ACP5RE_03605, partial [Candidatus Acidifodinimicrobium sp.]